MSHHTHEHHNLDNEENFKRIVAALDSEKRKQQLSAEAIIGYLPELAGKTVFDGGAGTGFLTLPLAKQAEKVIAFDQSQKNAGIDPRTSKKRTADKYHKYEW